jgi:hypothetical protein
MRILSGNILDVLQVIMSSFITCLIVAASLPGVVGDIGFDDLGNLEEEWIVTGWSNNFSGES